MASAWAKDLPVVTVPQAAAPTKRLTVVFPYYDQPEFFKRQQHWWFAYGSYLATEPLTIIVVDDGSPTAPAEQHFRKLDYRFPIRLFRVTTDVPWNWLAARNIGAFHAADGWLLLTDLDHVIPAETLRAVLHGQHDPDFVYVFARREHTGQMIPPHSASFLLTKAMFWKIGGYDETLSGSYGTDGEWRRRVAKVAPIQVLRQHLVRYERVGDSSTTKYERKLPEDARRVAKLIAARGPKWQPKTLSFPYREIAC